MSWPATGPSVNSKRCRDARCVAPAERISCICRHCPSIVTTPGLSGHHRRTESRQQEGEKNEERQQHAAAARPGPAQVYARLAALAVAGGRVHGGRRGGGLRREQATAADLPRQHPAHRRPTHQQQRSLLQPVGQRSARLHLPEPDQTAAGDGRRRAGGRRRVAQPARQPDAGLQPGGEHADHRDPGRRPEPGAGGGAGQRDWQRLHPGAAADGHRRVRGRRAATHPAIGQRDGADRVADGADRGAARHEPGVAGAAGATADGADPARHDRASALAVAGAGVGR